MAAFLLLAGARQAAAQLGTGGTSGLTGTGGSTAGTSFATSDFFVGIQAQKGVNLTTFESSRFFNAARCQCDTTTYVFVSLQQSGFAKRAQIIAQTGNTGTIRVFLGTGCENVLVAGSSSLCRQIASESLLTFLNEGSLELSLGARAMSTNLQNSITTLDGGTTNSSDPCSPDNGAFQQNVEVVLYYNNANTANFYVNTGVEVDLQPPPAPANISVQGGNEALIAKWDQVDQSTVVDLLGYQVLCSRADQYMVFNEHSNDAGGSNGPFSASFVTCPTAENVDAGVEKLNPTYVCSPLLSAISTSYRVETLQNDITYAAAVVAIDNSGNASQPTVVYGTPIKTLSFYDVYRDGYADSKNTNSPDPGAASGGFCAVGVRRPGWRSELGAITLVGIGAAVTLIRRRRQGRR